MEGGLGGRGGAVRDGGCKRGRPRRHPHAPHRRHLCFQGRYGESRGPDVRGLRRRQPIAVRAGHLHALQQHPLVSQDGDHLAGPDSPSRRRPDHRAREAGVPRPEVPDRTHPGPRRSCRPGLVPAAAGKGGDRAGRGAGAHGLRHAVLAGKLAALVAGAAARGPAAAARQAGGIRLRQRGPMDAERLGGALQCPRRTTDHLPAGGERPRERARSAPAEASRPLRRARLRCDRLGQGDDRAGPDQRHPYRQATARAGEDGCRGDPLARDGHLRPGAEAIPDRAHRSHRAARRRGAGRATRGGAHLAEPACQRRDPSHPPASRLGAARDAAVGAAVVLAGAGLAAVRPRPLARNCPPAPDAAGRSRAQAHGARSKRRGEAAAQGPGAAPARGVGGLLRGDRPRGDRISRRQAGHRRRRPDAGRARLGPAGAGTAGGAGAPPGAHPGRLRPRALRARQRRVPGEGSGARPGGSSPRRARPGDQVILLLAALLAAAEPAGAQLFADANAAYLSGDVSRATAAYEALVSEGVASTELETNLGAAYLRQGKRGLAVLHFERALFLQPGDDDASADLVEVRRGNVDRLEGDADEGGAETVARLLTPLPGTAAAAILTVLWPAAWILFGLRLLRGGPRWAGIAAAGCFGGALLFALLTWSAAAGRDMAMRRGVVVAQAVPAREGPAEKSVSRFEVHEGTTVRIDDEEPGFRRVKLATGLTGWGPSGTLA